MDTVRRIVLYVTDLLWVEHIETMEYTRSSVNLRAYGQRDPLVEYKKEGLHLFRHMQEIFRERVISLIETIKQAPMPEEHRGERERLIATHKQTKQFAMAGKQESTRSDQSIKTLKYEQIGRNATCTFGETNLAKEKCNKYKK